MKAKDSIFKTIMAPGAVQRLYALRQSGQPTGGARTRVAVGICLLLLAITTSLLIATAWVPHDVRSYVASRTDILALDENLQQWSATHFTQQACDFGPGCLARLRAAPRPLKTLPEIDAQFNPGPDSATLLLRLDLPANVFASMQAQQVIMLSLPSFNFFRADLYIDGRFSGTFYQGQRLAIGLPVTLLPAGGSSLRAEVVLAALPSDRTLAGNRNQEGILIASQGEFERYLDFLGAKRANAAGAMGHLSKIVLALFCLLLFLIVDSSPESFGLALFMGFEAAAMGVGQGWLPVGFLGVDHVPAFVHFCYQMGDILKLYFLLQMARIGRSSALPWLVAGAAVSLPYGLFMEYAAEANLAWTYKIARNRDTLVGGLGALACIASIIAIRKQRLPWRRAALAIAATAATFEVVNTWIAHSDWMRIYPTMRTLFTVFQANCGYLFALSTFLNISTLENRVKSLTAAAARAEAIEREMEIGQLVQQSLMRPPELPESVNLICHHEAALYVSGDTYYAHWDKQRHVVAFLVSDVTGHGVQAALKASACNVLAKTLWEADHTQELPGSGEGRRLEELDRLTARMLVEKDAIPDFNSLCGCEFNLETGRLAVYRSNFTFPILVTPVVEVTDDPEPVLGEFWSPEVIVSRNQEVVFRQLRRGSFVVLMSDGFMESSRDYKQFNTYLRRQLAQRETNVSVAELSAMVLGYDAFREKLTDDRTLMIFQWRHDAGKSLTKGSSDRETSTEESASPHGRSGAVSTRGSA